jgi:hypothetical protein
MGERVLLAGSSCDTCPLSRAEEVGRDMPWRWRCTADDLVDDDAYLADPEPVQDGDVPPWCPLRDGEVVVRREGE